MDQAEATRYRYRTMIAAGPMHEVDEHDDGTISVEAKPSNSNSILCPFCGWHGYIGRGVWREV